MFFFLCLLQLFSFISCEEQCTKKGCALFDVDETCVSMDVKQETNRGISYFVIDGKYISLKGLYWNSYETTNFINNEWVNFEGYRFLLDTGYPTSCINSYVKSRFGDNLLFNMRYVYPVLYGNQLSLLYGSLARIKFGDAQGEGIEISVPIGVGCASGDFDGYIGQDLIRTFYMILDPVKLKIVMPLKTLSDNAIKVHEKLDESYYGIRPFKSFVNINSLLSIANKKYKDIADINLWNDIVTYDKLMNVYLYTNFIKRALINHISTRKVDYNDKELPASILPEKLIPDYLMIVSAADLIASKRKQEQEEDEKGFFRSFVIEIPLYNESEYVQHKFKVVKQDTN